MNRDFNSLVNELADEAIHRRIGIRVVIGLITGRYIDMANKEAKGNKSKASKIAGIPRQTLYNKAKRFCR
jgi:transcriptional regulator of acetoin/glycerol metabolism